jgi:hypothetical protein
MEDNTKPEGRACDGPNGFRAGRGGERKDLMDELPLLLIPCLLIEGLEDHRLANHHGV